MREKFDKVIHSRVFIIVLILILICSTLLLGTYAWFTWSSTDNTKLVMSIGKLADVIFNSGNDINAELTPVYNYNDGVTTRFSINNRDTSGAKLGYDIYFNITTIDSELISEDVKWAIEENGRLVNEGNLSEASNGSSIKIGSGAIASGITSYTFYLYIDGNVENDPTMMGKTITGNIMVEASNGINLVNYITSLYNDADKTEVFNNDIPYNYATSVSLMNDGLGYGYNGSINNWEEFGASSKEECYAFLDCSDYGNMGYEDESSCNADLNEYIENEFGVPSVDGVCKDSDDGNIRYYGANPNNYIDIGDVFTEDTTVNNWEKFGAPSQEVCYDAFDCSVNYENMGFEDENSCNTGLSGFIEGQFGVSTLDEVCGTTIYSAGETKSLYRIIGVFKNMKLEDGTTADLVKVVRDNSIGNFSWDTDDGYGINEWSQADLMKLLNPGFETNTDEVCIREDEESDAICSTELVNNSLWWNGGSGNFYISKYYEGDTGSFDVVALSSNMHDKIESVVWDLGGSDDEYVFSNDIYIRERDENVQKESSGPSGPPLAGPSSSLPAVPLVGLPSRSLRIPLANYYVGDGITRTSEWTGRVALMYSSDIGYAVDFNTCDVSFSDYNDDCINNNYLAQKESHLLTPLFNSEFSMWGVSFSSPLFWSVYKNKQVLPTFYLKADTLLISGDGSRGNPYIVG